MKMSAVAPFLVVVLASAPREVASQEVPPQAVLPAPADSANRRSAREGKLPDHHLKQTAALSAGMAMRVGGAGGLVGLVLGYPGCADKGRDDPWDAFACLLHNDGMTYGIYTGTFMGAAMGAGRGASRAGCSPRASHIRSVIGSLAGSLPAISYLVAGGSGSKDVRRALAVGTPILQIVGATAAVSQCQVLRRP